jgi:hypothetical protein
MEYNVKVLMTFLPTLPLDDNPVAGNGGLSSALSTPYSFALYLMQCVIRLYEPILIIPCY